MRGIKRPFMKKFFVGGGLAILLIGLLWFPLIFFAVIPALGLPNIPTRVSASFEIGSYKPLYEVDVTMDNIYQFEEAQMTKIESLYSKGPSAKAFLEEFSATDVVATTLSIPSQSLWNISPPNLLKMIEEIESEDLKTCRFKYKISRSTVDGSSSESLQGIKELVMNQELRQNLLQILKNESNETIDLPYIFPKILVARNDGKLLPVGKRSLSSYGKTLYKNTKPN